VHFIDTTNSIKAINILLACN